MIKYNIQMDFQAVENNNIWNYLYRGEKCFQHQQESVFIMGDTRVGKSTFFNWLRGIRLKGVAKDYDTFYQASFDEAAQAKLTFQSVTTIPNTDEIAVNGKMMKGYDFAGFEDDGRGYAEVFTVSFMIKESARFIENTKFILVIESASLITNQIRNRIHPFLHFTTMFKEDLLADEKALENFIHSVVVVVTKTEKKYDEYLARTSNIAEFLANRTDPESVLLTKLIENIVNNRRLFLFPIAQEGSFAYECKLMEEMNRQQKKWQYYGWKKNNKYVQLPFKSQFRKLEEIEQDAFQREISQKQYIFKLSCQILKNCILKASQKFKNNSVQYTQEFRQIQQLIQKYNTYGKFEFSKIERTKPREPEKNVSILKTFKSLNQAVQIIYQILELQEAQDINGDGSGYLDSIHQCQKKCRQLFAYFRDTLCSCEREQTLFLNFAFLFLQAIMEFGNIYSIDNSRGADALQTIKDELNQLITGNTYSEAKYEFFVNFRTQSIDERQEVIDEILKLLEQDFIIKNDFKKSSTLMRKVIQLYINQAQSFKNKLQFQKGIEVLLKAWSYVQREPSEQEENVKIFQERVEYFTYRIFSKVGECLVGLNLIDSAIKVFEKLKFVDKMNICYKKSFEKERDLEKKYQKMLDYGNFCEKYCRIQDALNLYQKMHDQFYFLFPTKKEEISNRIYECLGSEIKDKYADYKNTLFDKVKFDIQEEFIREIEIRVKKCEDDIMSEGNTTYLQEAYRNEDSIFEQQYIQNVEPSELFQIKKQIKE